MSGKRPAQTGQLVGVRLQPDQLQRLDDWIEEFGGHYSRPEAIRILLEHAWGRTAASRGLQPLRSRIAVLPDDKA